MTGRKRPKPVTKMNADELAKATAEFDDEFSADTFGEPPVEAKAKWERAKRKRGRPRRGKGAKVISVSVERGLLARSDRLAKRLGISRAALVARGLHAALALAGDEEEPS
jgi:hypothetical protein